MKVNLLPKTVLGKWASILSILFIVLIAWKIAFQLPLPTFFIVALGLSGFVSGIIAIINKDRGLLISISILVGVVILVWISTEIIYPH